MLKPSVQIHNENGVLVAEFWDCLRLDPGAVQDLRAKYEVHLRGGGRPELVIDLLGVGFAGSASLGHFVALHRIARPKNGRLVFCNTDPQVFEVFKVSKLEPLFDFVADRAAALELIEKVAAGVAAGAPAGAQAGTDGPSKPGRDGLAPAAPRRTGDGVLHSSRRKKLS